MSTIERMYEEEMKHEASRVEPNVLQEADVSLCSIRVGDELFGIDTLKVREVLGRRDVASRRGLNAGSQARHDLRRVPLAPAYVAGVIPYRGEVLTTLSLQALLGGGQDASGGCVLVLDDEETGELLGLMVGAVSGVVTVHASMREANPCTLSGRSKALFEGVYKMPSGLMARIDPRRLSPGRLSATGLFDTDEGRARCAR